MDVPLTAGSVFAERYRRERRIAHGERKWSYYASEMKARGRRRAARTVMGPGLIPLLASEKRKLWARQDDAITSWWRLGDA